MKEADNNQPSWPNKLQLLDEIFITWAICFSGNHTYTGIIIIYVRDMCILSTRLASRVFTEIFLFLKLLCSLPLQENVGEENLFFHHVPLFRIPQNYVCKLLKE